MALASRLETSAIVFAPAVNSVTAVSPGTRRTPAQHRYRNRTPQASRALSARGNRPVIVRKNLPVPPPLSSAAALPECGIALLPEPRGYRPEFGILESNCRHQPESRDGLWIDAFLFVRFFEKRHQMGNARFFGLESLMVPIGQRRNRRRCFGGRIDGMTDAAIAFENFRSVGNCGKRYRCH